MKPTSDPLLLCEELRGSRHSSTSEDVELLSWKHLSGLVCVVVSLQQNRFGIFTVRTLKRMAHISWLSCIRKRTKHRSSTFRAERSADGWLRNFSGHAEIYNQHVSPS